MYKEDKLKAFIDSGEASVWAAGKRYAHAKAPNEPRNEMPKDGNGAPRAGFSGKKPDAAPPTDGWSPAKEDAKHVLMKLGMLAKDATARLSGLSSDLSVEDLVRAAFSKVS